MYVEKSGVCVTYPQAVPAGWTCSDSADASRCHTPPGAFSYKMFAIVQTSPPSILLLTFLFISLSSPSFLSLSFFTHFLLLLSLSSSFSLSFFLNFLFLPRPWPTPPLSRRPHQRSWSLVSLFSWLAQRGGRHMGELFCNPAGHTTLAWEGVGVGGGRMQRARRGGRREEETGLYGYFLTYTFAASLCLWHDGLSLFSHCQQEVSSPSILSSRREWWSGARGRKEGERKWRKCGNERRNEKKEERVWKCWMEDGMGGREASMCGRPNQWRTSALKIFLYRKYVTKRKDRVDVETLCRSSSVGVCLKQTELWETGKTVVVSGRQSGCLEAVISAVAVHSSAFIKTLFSTHDVMNMKDF